MRALGFSIAGGVIYACAVDSAAKGLGDGLTEGNRKFEASSSLNEVDRQADLTDRLVEYIGTLNVDRAVLTEVRMYSQWKYRSAYTHVMGIAAILAACHRTGTRFSTVTTAAISKVVNVPAADLPNTDPTLFGYEAVPTYWKAGLGPAHAAAAYGVAGDGS